MQHLNDVLRNLSQEESRTVLRKFYTGAYQLGIYRPSGAIDTWNKIFETKISFTKALDVGCGLGWGVLMCNKVGKKCIGIDIAPTLSDEWKKKEIVNYCLSADALHLPFKDNSFDLVVCNDVLEHIPEYDIDAVLKEIFRVGSDKFALLPALTEEIFPLCGEIYAHITLKPASWWNHKFERNGFTLAGIVDQKEGNVGHLFTYAVKDKKPYIRGERTFRA